MDLPFYDCALGDTELHAGHCGVDRVYRLDLDHFEPRDWDALMAIYAGLPGWIPADDLPRWFGVDEAKPPFLVASVEPPGLQVSGWLAPGDWARWDREFRAAAAGLPRLPPVE
jgi:hypothetical protein